MSEEMVVKHCSPTLAGMKTGNMFSCEFKDINEMRESIRRLNRALAKKGIRVIPLRHRENRTLIYVFRPSMLMKDLSDDRACRILEERGYEEETPAKCIVRLMKNLKDSSEFPHEIGLFLGYPPEDVCGFIENKSGACKCVGCWKVYGDEEKAKETFAKYKECAEVYYDRWSKGFTLEGLTAAYCNL